MLLQSQCQRAFACIESLFCIAVPSLTFQCFPDNTEYLFCLHRFGQIVHDTFFNRFHCTGYVPVACHDKERNTIAMCIHPFQQFHAIAVVETKIRQYQIHIMIA